MTEQIRNRNGFLKRKKEKIEFKEGRNQVMTI